MVMSYGMRVQRVSILLLGWLLLAAPVSADTLTLDGATYIGRVFALNEGKLLFDFDCSGAATPIDLKVGDHLTIGGHCEDQYPPEIGGRRVCAEKVIHDKLFTVSFTSVELEGLETWIDAVSNVQVTSTKIRLFYPSGDLLVVDRPVNASEVFNISPVPRDFCLNESRELD
jgi:hypothetical protein